ncbi:hypothetical protein COCNU_04G015890 [Cocos nucifera]|uniref:Uncharacterized protein n=1 Tax=Cocos nucifera TaxID=13894 RepID=A0A8K0I8L5_COCNU|nr:hypothetical protein COCNU_04G015890 [Cocos nucifera]
MESRRASLFFLLLLVCVQVHISMGAEARPLPSIKQERYVQVLESLGLNCRCCDGAGGECRTTWNSTCAKLDCLPWKFL